MMQDKIHKNESKSLAKLHTISQVLREPGRVVVVVVMYCCVMRYSRF